MARADQQLMNWMSRFVDFCIVTHMAFEVAHSYRQVPGELSRGACSGLATEMLATEGLALGAVRLGHILSSTQYPDTPHHELLGR